MKKVLSDIQDGTFARNWILENKTNRPYFNAQKKMHRESVSKKSAPNSERKWDGRQMTTNNSANVKAELKAPHRSLLKRSGLLTIR